jgi:hypothetical protein
VRTPEQDREYQRQRREKVKAMADQTASPNEAAIAKTMLGKEPPDYRTLIQSMTQEQQSAILAKLPVTKRSPR